jgi:plastocyanin
MLLRVALIALLSGMASAGFAAADPSAVLTIRKQQFEPKHLQLPQGTKVRLTIRNEDTMPAEFESYDLSREVVIPANGQATVYVGPLKPGEYAFFNDFNPSMKGQVVVKTDAAQGN